jgi:hypothetical protein
MNYDHFISEERLIYHKALDAMRMDMRLTFKERRQTRTNSEVVRIEESTQNEL